MGEWFHNNKFNSLHIHRVFLWEKQKMENTCTPSAELTENLRANNALPSQASSLDCPHSSESLLWTSSPPGKLRGRTFKEAATPGHGSNPLEELDLNLGLQPKLGDPSF